MLTCRRTQPSSTAIGTTPQSVHEKIPIGGSAGPERNSTATPVGFRDFVGLANWFTGQLQAGVGPSVDVINGNNLHVLFFGLLNFHSNPTDETGKGAGVSSFVGAIDREGKPFAIP
jgi:hypothetical protein